MNQARRLLLSLASLVLLGSGEASGAQLTASWVDNSNGRAITGIERRVGTGSVFVRVADVSPGITTWVDTSVSPGVTYCYRALAYDEEGVSPYSEEACAAPPNPLTVALSSPTQGATIDGTVSVSATASTAATRIDLLLDGALVGVYQGTTASYSWDTSTSANGTHRWVARAYDSSAATVNSSALDVVVNNVIPAAPSPVEPPSVTTPTASTMPTTTTTTANEPAATSSAAPASPETTAAASVPAPSTPTTASTTIPTTGAATTNGPAGTPSAGLASAETTATAPVPAPPTPATAWTMQATRGETTTRESVRAALAVTSPPPLDRWSSALAAAAPHIAAALDGYRLPSRASTESSSDDTTAAPPEVAISSGSARETSPAPAPALAVTLISPGGNSTAQGTIPIAAVASLEAVHIELLLDGVRIAASPGTKITFAWDTTAVANGTHRWTARAYDAAGETVGSIPLDVVVGNVRASTSR